MQEMIDERLEKHNLRKTNMRREVLRLFLDAEGKALANRDIEQALDNPDRITLYRTLKSFEDKGLVHLAVDSSGTTKYALCSDNCTTHEHKDEHAHFHCNNCGQTLCLAHEIVPVVNVPEGFQIEKSYLVLEGICADCTV